MALPILNVRTKKRQVGNRGERAAVRYLRAHGYRIREKNYVAAGHEIDVICEKKNTLVFVEVKTRTENKLSPKEPRPACAVTPEKQRAIISASNYYVKTLKDAYRMRFDIIEVYLSERKLFWQSVRKIDHLEAAFNGDTARHRSIR